MKKFTLLALITISLSVSAFAQQVFQGTFVSAGNNQLVFKIKPSSTITTQISYMQFGLGFPQSSSFTYTLTPNTSTLPGLSMDTIASYNDGTYTFYNFVQTSGVIGSATYNAGTEYTVFTLTLTGPSNVNFQLASDSTLETKTGFSSYLFYISDGSG